MRKKYTIYIGGIAFIMLFLFLLKKHLGGITGFSWPTPIDLFLMIPTYPLWKLLKYIPSEPILLNDIFMLMITTLFWVAVGYGIDYLTNRSKKNK